MSSLSWPWWGELVVWCNVRLLSETHCEKAAAMEEIEAAKVAKFATVDLSQCLDLCVRLCVQ